MKKLSRSLMFLSLLVSQVAGANTDRTKECLNVVQEQLNTYMEEHSETFREAKSVVHTILEVGPGSENVEHVAIFSEANRGGEVYLATFTGESFAHSCYLSLRGVKSLNYHF